ncbi:MAG: DUF3010 family protein [Saprospiraceae bacterium]|uniref:DUF3010 family protein n=1 Tax=Candidatus Opimibacter skivensis TaxID=2982028 RepID=A0A9D7SYC5_9BACT|nr:DUF3010 family protein [Candidatus Opimibacter skivensis]
MKVIGIDIDKTKAIFYILEEDQNGNLKNRTGSFRSLTLTDDTDNASIRTFQSTVHSFFDKTNPDRIGILKRQTKGRFRSAPLSFKIEGLLQCYEEIEMEFIQPIRVTNFFKKNVFILDLEFEYQEDAAKLAWYMLKSSPNTDI